MIHGIGTDIVEIARFQRFLDENNNALLQRLFTDSERELCRKRREQASCLAARFAAKEAFLKALGTGLRDGISFVEVEVVRDGLGKPHLNLSGRADEIFRQRNLAPPFLSLSHDGGCAIAMVVLEAP